MSYFNFKNQKTLEHLLQNIININHDLYTDISTNKAKYFSQIIIPKKGKKEYGNYRIVYKASPTVQQFYKSIAMRIGIWLSVNQYFENQLQHSYGYIQGKNIFENAKQHCSKKLVLKADIKDFFPSISKEKITQSIMSEFKLQENLAQELSSFLTINNSLPIGLHTSPIISNLVCINLDKRIATLSSKYNCTYTRYADDITISGNNILPPIEKVEELLNEEGFLLNKKKVRITKPGMSHFVTGLSISDKIPHVPRYLKRRLRQIIYYCNKFGFESHVSVRRNRSGLSEFNKINGLLNYISYIEKGRQIDNLKQTWQRIVDKKVIANEILPYIDPIGGESFFYVDESRFKIQNKEFLVLSSIRIIGKKNNNAINDIIDEIKNNILADPYSNDIKKETLKKEGIHFCSLTEDGKRKVNDLLYPMTYKSHLIYSTINANECYQSLYLKMLKRLLDFPTRSSSIINIHIEQNSNINQNYIKQCLSNLKPRSYNILGLIKKSVQIVDKSCHLIALPDCMLGFFYKYITEAVNPIKNSTRYSKFFEKIRDKYSVIIDHNNNQKFNRKRKFTAEDFLNNIKS